MTQDQRVGIVTVGYNSARHLPAFLACLRAQHGARIHLYYVDNASPDDGLALVETADAPEIDVTVIRNRRNVGVAAGNNAGIRAALAEGHDWVLLLNNDTEFGPDLVAGLVEVAQRGSHQLLAPVIATDDAEGSLWYGGGSIHPWQGFRVVHDGMYERPASERVTRDPSEVTDYASTCCLLVRADVFTLVGLMDESYFVYSDDVDFAVRCRAAGVRTHVTSRVRLVHKDGGSTGGNLSPFSVWWLTRNWVLVGRRHLPRHRMPLALAYMQVWIWGRRLLGREPWAVTRLRLAAVREGLRLDLDDHDVPTETAPPARFTR